MKIYDISQEVFGSKVFPGDPAPDMQAVMRIAEGGKCNLSAFFMCAHNGTHVDAPFHFYEDHRGDGSGTLYRDCLRGSA